MSETAQQQAPITSTHKPDLKAIEPGTLWIMSRDKDEVRQFQPYRISTAITKAFLAIEGAQAAGSNRIHETVEQLTQQIVETLHRRYPLGATLHVEDIQDQVELTLMRLSEAAVAKAYVLYREERRKLRDKQADFVKQGKLPLIQRRNGQKTPLNIHRLYEIVTRACENIADVKPDGIIQAACEGLFDGATEVDLANVLIMSARTLIEVEPNYTYVAARLLLDNLRSEALSFLNIAENATASDMPTFSKTYFKAYLEKGIALELIDPQLAEFNLEKIISALQIDRDLQFTYLGLQTLYDRYFLHHDRVRFELPQAFFMRVAMGLAIRETHREEKAIEFYHVLSTFAFMSSTPTLFNAGTLRPQLSSCFLTTVPDDLAGIYSAIKDNALLSKFAGGLGNDWTPVRALGAYIKGTNGQSQGVVPFLNVANATAVAVNQGGKRKGAVCAYLETWHLDIEEFIELRKNTGDDRRRTHDMNTAHWVPDLFMKRAGNNESWTLFSPSEVPELHDLYGKEFEAAYLQCEAKAKQGEIKLSKIIPAVNLWRKMLSMLFETGHPWITFKDPCNIRSPQQHAGVVHSSNLCTEITLNTSADEIAVCNLGSINLPYHLDEEGHINQEQLKKTVSTAIRMLDNVIDINYYAVPQAKNSNLKHRPIGLGIMGFQDALYKRKLSYCSDAAFVFADRSMELISYYAIEASSQLAKERGKYPSFNGSLWSKGILPIDSIKLLKEERVDHLEQDTSSTLDWDSLRKHIKTYGMRNSNVLAIAPTATISNICGVSQSIEPTYQNLYVKSNLSGEFTVVNPYLAKELKQLNLWDSVMVHDLKFYDGSVQSIERIPRELKERYATAFEVEPRCLIEAASRRQKWIDQAQSLNLYLAQPSGKKLDALYQSAWRKGLKTTYYLRTLGATSTEKSTIETGQLNQVKLEKACSITDPNCDACQ